MNKVDLIRTSKLGHNRIATEFAVSAVHRLEQRIKRAYYIAIGRQQMKSGSTQAYDLPQLCLRFIRWYGATNCVIDAMEASKWIHEGEDRVSENHIILDEVQIRSNEEYPHEGILLLKLDEMYYRLSQLPFGSKLYLVTNYTACNRCGYTKYCEPDESWSTNTFGLFFDGWLHARISNRKQYRWICEDCQEEDKKYHERMLPAPKVNPRNMSNKLRYVVFKRDGFRCQFCGATPADGAKLHVDHIIPVSKGGTSEMDNLQTLCSDCNMGKFTDTA